eukprot:gene6774-8097_t
MAEGSVNDELCATVLTPTKVASGFMSSKCLYPVTTQTNIFLYPKQEAGHHVPEGFISKNKSTHILRVQRDYEDFCCLNDVIKETCPGVIRPAFPKEHVNDSDPLSAKTESRRAALDLYLKKLTSHPTLKIHPFVRTFLTIAENEEFKEVTKNVARGSFGFCGLFAATPVTTDNAEVMRAEEVGFQKKVEYWKVHQQQVQTLGEASTKLLEAYDVVAQQLAVMSSVVKDMQKASLVDKQKAKSLTRESQKEVAGMRNSIIGAITNNSKAVESLKETLNERVDVLSRVNALQAKPDLTADQRVTMEEDKLKHQLMSGVMEDEFKTSHQDTTVELCEALATFLGKQSALAECTGADWSTLAELKWEKPPTDLHSTRDLFAIPFDYTGEPRIETTEEMAKEMVKDHADSAPVAIPAEKAVYSTPYKKFNSLTQALSWMQEIHSLRAAGIKDSDPSLAENGAPTADVALDDTAPAAEVQEEKASTPTDTKEEAETAPAAEVVTTAAAAAAVGSATEGVPAESEPEAQAPPADSKPESQNLTADSEAVAKLLGNIIV